MLDPKLWNLFVGVAFVAGCGAGGIDSGGEHATPSTSEAGSGGEASPECVSDNECGFGYECIEGQCEYTLIGDGHFEDDYDYEPTGGDCYSDLDCEYFEDCEQGLCTGEPPTFPPHCEDPATSILIPSDEAVLALTFADVDADGRDELVLATATSFEVHGVDAAPIVTPREPGAVQSMVSGAFDDVVGDDLLLLVDGELRRYGASMGSYASLGSAPAPIELVEGLLAGASEPMTAVAVLGFGAMGAYVDVDGVVTVVTDQPVLGAAMLPSDGSLTFALLQAGGLSIHALAGGALAGDPVLVPVTPGFHVLSELAGPGGLGYVLASPDKSYAQLMQFELGSGAYLADWNVAKMPIELLAGDLDGDSVDELVFNFSPSPGLDNPNGTLAIELAPQTRTDCWGFPSVPTVGAPRGVAFGDHDGDGDLELGILSSVGEVALLDGG